MSMELNIKIRERESGFIEASCLELGLLASAPSLEQALDRIKDMIVLLTASGPDAGLLEPTELGRLYITQSSDKIH